MAEIRRRGDFAEETFGAECGGEFGAEHLHRDLTLVFVVLGEIHRRHTTGTKLALDAITAGQRRLERTVDCCHVAAKLPRPNGERNTVAVRCVARATSSWRP